MKALPRGIRTLKAVCVRLEADLIEFLPPGLTRLLASCEDPESSGLFVLQYHSEEDAKKDQEELFKRKPLFPKTIVNLEISDIDHATRSIGELIESPVMYSLVRMRDGSIENSEIQNLPSMLTTLIFSDAHRVMGSSFSDLPRSLRHLDLSASIEVYDEDILKLPRNLQYLRLSSTPHLTNACLADFPRYLEHLDLRNTHRITREEGAELLPKSLFLPNLSPSISFNSLVFQISSGQILCKKYQSH
jgi:hypothetical protein